MRLLILLFVLLPILLPGQVPILKNAHSHNDYTRETPLFEAMNVGFKSIEADIQLIHGDLYVAHDMPSLLKKITLPDLEETYLLPLDSLIEQGGGNLYSNSNEELFLLIDIKTEGKATFKILNDQLYDHRDILTHWHYGVYKRGVVKVIISGNRPFEDIENAKVRMATIDGRPSDLGKGYSSELMPLISQRYGKVIKWNGKGDMPSKEIEKLKALTTKAHDEGKLVRLWASPENEKVWEVLLMAGVDLINTDEINRLKRFLIKRNQIK